LKIITLLENHQDPDQPELKAEHGVSFYIENNGNVFMSDVGQSRYFADNALKLGIDLSAVEALAISHHHYDHGGGLRHFFEVNKTAPVYLKSSPPDVDYVEENAGQPLGDIGLDKVLLKEFENRIVYITEKVEIPSGFHLLTDIPETYPKPRGDERLKMKKGDVIVPDTFDHEIVTVLETDDGLVILTGCGHNGVLNMIEAARRAFPGKPVIAMIGGFHLHHESERSVRDVAKAILSMGIPAVYTGHCTGEDALDILEDELGERLHRLTTGMIIHI